MKQIKQEIKPYRRKLNQEQDIIDILVDKTPQQRSEEIKRDLVVTIDETSKIKTMACIVDDIFDMEKEKFTAEKLAFGVLNDNLRSDRPNPKYVTMIAAPQFKKPKVVLNLNVENMTPQELIDFMVKARGSKGEV